MMFQTHRPMSACWIFAKFSCGKSWALPINMNAPAMPFTDYMTYLVLQLKEVWRQFHTYNFFLCLPLSFFTPFGFSRWAIVLQNLLEFVSLNRVEILN